MRFVSGSRFSGDFRGGLFHGHGTYTDANGGTRRWWWCWWIVRACWRWSGRCGSEFVSSIERA